MHEVSQQILDDEYPNYNFIKRSYEGWFEICALDGYRYFVNDIEIPIYAYVGDDAPVIGYMPPTFIPFTITEDSFEAFRECEYIVEAICLEEEGFDGGAIHLLTDDEQDTVDEILCSVQEDLYHHYSCFVEDILKVWNKHNLFYILTQDEHHVIGEIAEEYCYEINNSPLIGVW